VALSPRVSSWVSALSVYRDRRVLAILVLGFASGLPLALTGQTLQAWLKESGVSLQSIGLFALVGVPYTLKFLWAPLIDRVPLPILTRWLGRRRSWLIFAQALLMAAIVALALSNPGQALALTAVFAVGVAFASATQDIVIDAWRVEILEQRQLAAGAASIVFGYRIGMLVSSAGALYLADQFAWPLVYLAMAALLVGSVRSNVFMARTRGYPSALEASLAAVEDGTFGRAFSSGMAATDCVLRAVLRPGDHIVIPDDAYGGTFRLIDKVFTHWGISHTPGENRAGGEKKS